MTDNTTPQLDLGQPPGKLKSRLNGVSRSWLVAVLVLQAATLGFIVYSTSNSGRSAKPTITGVGGGSAAALRRVAQELEDKSLDGQAAEAWQKYLEAAGDVDDSAEILYRTGKLYLQANQIDRAATAFVRSELAAGENTELKAKIGPRLVECLRRLGLYGEVGREMSRRVEVGADKTAQGKVLATIAGEPVTEADRDRMIQHRVDQMLSVQGAAGDESRRQAMLQQFSNPDVQQQLFQELLQTGLFTRRARELKLDRQDDFIEARRALEENLLASRFMSNELSKINPTDADLQPYFQANQKRYEQPETATVRWIALAADEDAAALLQKIGSADSFRKLAKQRQTPTDGSGQNAEASATITRGRLHPQLGSTDKLFALKPNEWTKQPHEHGSQRCLVLVESKTPASTPGFDEVRDAVAADYSAQKRQEVIQHVFHELMTRYSVKIMPPNSDDKPTDDKHSDGDDKTDPQTDDKGGNQQGPTK